MTSKNELDLHNSPHLEQEVNNRQINTSDNRAHCTDDTIIMLVPFVFYIEVYAFKNIVTIISCLPQTTFSSNFENKYICN